MTFARTRRSPPITRWLALALPWTAAMAAACLTGCSASSSPEQAYSSLHSASGIGEDRDYDTIIAEFKAFSAKHADLTEIVRYGSSGENRELMLMKLRDPRAGGNGVHPAVLISEGIHGNEYLHITDRLPEQFLEASAADSAVRRFVAAGGIVYLLPIMNPDGFARGQRENGRGQDLNRDFSIKAAGNRGFTQPETAAIRDYMAKEALGGADGRKVALEASMQYHCCIGGLIHPWAYTADPLPPATQARHSKVGDDVKALFGYQTGTVREIVGYAALGGSDDYYLETYGRRAFSFEGVEGREAGNLDKHVELWQRTFATINAETAAAAGSDGGGAPDADVYLALGDATADARGLYVATPAAYDHAVVCAGDRQSCLADKTGGRQLRATFVRSVGAQRLYKVDQPPPFAAGLVMTVFASKSDTVDASSPARSVALRAH